MVPKRALKYHEALRLGPICPAPIFPVSQYLERKIKGRETYYLVMPGKSRGNLPLMYVPEMREDLISLSLN